MPFCARDLVLHPRATRCSAFDPSTFWPWRINAQRHSPSSININGPHADRKVLFSVGYPQSCDTSRAGSLPHNSFCCANRPTESAPLC